MPAVAVSVPLPGPLALALALPVRRAVWWAPGCALAITTSVAVHVAVPVTMPNTVPVLLPILATIPMVRVAVVMAVAVTFTIAVPVPVPIKIRPHGPGIGACRAEVTWAGVRLCLNAPRDHNVVVVDIKCGVHVVKIVHVVHVDGRRLAVVCGGQGFGTGGHCGRGLESVPVKQKFIRHGACAREPNPKLWA